MKSLSVLFAFGLVFGITTGCHPPSTTGDVAVRASAKLTKDSTITLTAGNDGVKFKPELEKEMIRKGFNVISDLVSETISQEKKTGEAKAGAVTTSSDDATKAAAKVAGDELITRQNIHRMKSEFVGKLDYFYDASSQVVTKVNLTIARLDTGVVAVSLSYDIKAMTNRARTNPEAAAEIATYLDTALATGAK
ncbi:hypothetical protein [Geothrix fuzhouensis]|uniref:hypothetical protein n=1 Tax=Geothrix fuzhouensis TaxID=2966451 RepID=UPI002148ACD2|nr:hypothetical protein [Geothrix fuzhouensis]